MTAVNYVRSSAASGPGDPVTLDLGGCGGVTNGHVVRMFDGTVAERMLRLVKPLSP
jgi:hypothetical protein